MTAQQAQTIVAAFDIGSNSIKMTVAAVSANSGIQELFSATKTVRLGEGIDTSGELAADRIDAALEALRDMSARARQAGATRMIAVATEAVRIARNGQDFLDRVEQENGIATIAIPGDEEAKLGFTGMLADTGLTGTIVMADIGGGSSEIVIGDESGVKWARSFPIGSGRLTDAHVVADPPTRGELRACEDAAANGLADAPLGMVANAHLVIAGGTGEYLGRLVQSVAAISREEIVATLELVTTLTADELAHRVEIPPIRARVLPAGIAVVAAIADRLNPARISGARSGLRTGLLLQAAKDQAE